MGPGAFRRIALRKGHDEEEGERKRRLLVARAKADKGGETSIHAANLPPSGDTARASYRLFVRHVLYTTEVPSTF